ncbi:hypothetical protein [Pedobacter steynii]
MRWFYNFREAIYEFLIAVKFLDKFSKELDEQMCRPDQADGEIGAAGAGGIAGTYLITGRGEKCTLSFTK